MKKEKIVIFSKKRNFLFFKIFLWICVGVLFTSISVLIPTTPESLYKEIFIFIFLATIINIHTSYLYQKVSKKSRLGYIFLLVCSIFFCAFIEMQVFSKNFEITYYDFLNKNELYPFAFGYIIIRDFTLFIFFLWLEYYNRLIHLYYKKEKIHQEEISLLIEKQEFEKKFSRKKIFPHYFFNILEHLCAQLMDKNNESELIHKIKFVLYYFLVDAEKEKVELDKELMFYNYYIELENFRHQNKISTNLSIQGDPQNYFIIPLLFEPLVGNAMKYTKHDGSGMVDIKFDVTHFPVLSFYCKNNFSYHLSNVTSSENGLKILVQRLELCYKNKYSLEIKHEEEFYEVFLSIDIE